MREKPPELFVIILSIVIFIRSGSDNLLTVSAIHNCTEEEAPWERACPGQQKREDEQRTNQKPRKHEQVPQDHL